MSSSDDEVLSHHLRIFGLTQDTDWVVLTGCSAEMADALEFRASNGAVIISQRPSQDFCNALGVEVSDEYVSDNMGWLTFSDASECPVHQFSELRSYYSAKFFHGSSLTAVVRSESGNAAWVWKSYGRGGILLIGTFLSQDLLRYRQGDPKEAANRPTGALWGIAGERPNYLFEKQLEGLSRHDRQADYWVKMLVDFVAQKLGVTLQPMLPDGAPGAIVITGDDDQAYLEKYAEQLKLLGKTPITYFLHPQTRHTRKTLKSMLGKKWIDLGLHPDALDAPDQYGKLLKVQSSWYEGLVGRRAISLRNHGFLNDGYWGHLDHWLKEGLLFSSNLPGLDGRILNGSLLPARLFFDGKFTPHWSILTAIGDGVRFISGMTDADAARCVLDMADRVRKDIVPGVMVLNLHPQNIEETREMHRAVLEVIDSGFVAWTVRECMEWFLAKDDPTLLNCHAEEFPPFSGWWKKITGHFANR